ncbi:MAG: hypothetical protein IJU02_07420 [Lachnospiraceae bacterium]|nr:hypothetical protein [Lachnospiraceae bacterium]
MGFSKGNVSTEGAELKRYVGVASVFVRGINPTKEELSKFFNREIENSVDYVGQLDTENGKVDTIRIDFLVEADKEKYPDVDLKSRVTIFLRKEARISKAGKKQVIDKYGRTAWATPEEIEQKVIPVYSNGKPANIDKDYRVAYSGEEDLVKFLIAYLNIPSPQKYVNGEWVMQEANKLPDCEAMLECIDSYFKGDIGELKQIIGFQPTNKVKVLFGVRTADDGRQFQTTYTRMFLKNGVSDYSKLDKEVKEAQNAGALSTCTFECTELHEYKIDSTDFAEDVKAATPWD